MKIKTERITEKKLQQTIKRIASGRLSTAKAYQALQQLPYLAFDGIKLDMYRHLRKPIPEAIYCEGKSFQQLKTILKQLQKNKAPVFLTRLMLKQYQKLRRVFPKLQYDHIARLGYFKKTKPKTIQSRIAIVTAGSSDLPIAEEAGTTLEWFGHTVSRFYDCGVAAIQRTIDVIPQLKEMDMVIVIAGMEGALVSVLAGLVEQPMIAVPSSVGYGANFKGLSALLTMLNTCAPGVVCVNIDNGFGAACFAHLCMKRGMRL